MRPRGVNFFCPEDPGSFLLMISRPLARPLDLETGDLVVESPGRAWIRVGAIHCSSEYERRVRDVTSHAHTHTRTQPIGERASRVDSVHRGAGPCGAFSSLLSRMTGDDDDSGSETAVETEETCDAPSPFCATRRLYVDGVRDSHEFIATHYGGHDKVFVPPHVHTLVLRSFVVTMDETNNELRFGDPNKGGGPEFLKMFESRFWAQPSHKKGDDGTAKKSLLSPVADPKLGDTKNAMVVGWFVESAHNCSDVPLGLRVGHVVKHDDDKPEMFHFERVVRKHNNDNPNERFSYYSALFMPRCDVTHSTPVRMSNPIFAEYHRFFKTHPRFSKADLNKPPVDFPSIEGEEPKVMVHASSVLGGYLLADELLSDKVLCVEIAGTRMVVAPKREAHEAYQAINEIQSKQEKGHQFNDLGNVCLQVVPVESKDAGGKVKWRCVLSVSVLVAFLEHVPGGVPIDDGVGVTTDALMASLEEEGCL